MITVEQLNRTYGPLHAVKNVSFTIQQGEIIGLLGPNGAGKTTIMKMLCGFLEPSSGQVTINGADITQNAKTAQSYIGYLPENLPVYPEMTVIAYLEYAARLRGVPENEQWQEIRRVIGETELDAKALARIGALSRGLKQRVGVAQALLGSPSVLVLDEPTNGLDPTQTLHMRSLIRKLAQSATVILSTHILSEVEAVCDRVLMVRNGELALDSRLNDLQKTGVIRVRCSLSPEQMQALLSDLPGLSHIQMDLVEGGSEGRVAVALDQPKDDLCAQVARAVVQGGGHLYQLHHEQRDLESLFREVNSAEVISNAA